MNRTNRAGIPPGAEARDFVRSNGTTEVVPFPTRTPLRRDIGRFVGWILGVKCASQGDLRMGLGR
jgi:hypothetical protein